MPPAGGGTTPPRVSLHLIKPSEWGRNAMKVPDGRKIPNMEMIALLYETFVPALNNYKINS